MGFLGGGGGIEARIFFLTWGFIPEELIRGEPYTTFTTGAITRSIETPVPTWVTIFSSMFMHGGFMHFAGNMMFLWVFGDNIEDRLGHVKYLFFYLFTGVVATLAHFAIDPSSETPLVGASGAISGVSKFAYAPSMIPARAPSSRVPPIKGRITRSASSG